jgi:hypothetical protein
MDLGEIRISATQDSRESSEEGSSNIMDLDGTGGPVSHGAAGLRLASSKRVCLDCKRARCCYAFVIAARMEMCRWGRRGEIGLLHESTDVTPRLARDSQGRPCR